MVHVLKCALCGKVRNSDDCWLAIKRSLLSVLLVVEDAEAMSNPYQKRVFDISAFNPYYSLMILSTQNVT